MGRRVLAIGLDGFDESLGSQRMAAGELPALAALRSRSARFLLDHGAAQRTGLAWEHVSSGMSPEHARRFAAVHFDPATYSVRQQGTESVPFPARLRARTIVFDAPYFDLDRAPAVQGVVGWGAHDPGVPLGARPDPLRREIEERFGSYPAAEWIYGHVWPSAERARRMGEELAHAVDVRAAAARWLLRERLPDWDLALVVVSEPHSAIEGLWHGVDVSHPLHRLPSASPARSGLRSVLQAVDRLVGELATLFPDDALVVFSMGGMGPNRSDVPSMVLLPELLYRHQFGRPHLRQPDRWFDAAEIGPPLDEREDWPSAVNRNLPSPRSSVLAEIVARLLPHRLRPTARTGPERHPPASRTALQASLDWMPAARYQPYWRRMRAFALPSYYDGRIRVSLAGRERNGKIPVACYASACGEIEELVRRCRDPATGETAVDTVERVRDRDPRTFGETEADLVVVWKGLPLALDHPTLGRIGPVPFRRPGGHTGRYGMAYVRDAGIEPGDRGIRSSFDVVPTLIGLLGESVPDGLSGQSFLSSPDPLGEVLTNC